MPDVMGTSRIRRAIASVSDKRGLVDFCRALARHGVTILSTGGTAKELGAAARARAARRSR